MQAIELNFLDYGAFVGFLAGLSIIGYLAGRGERTTSNDYFLAGRKLPWYAVGGSFIASNISSEHFIGMVGASYIFGVSMAMWEWTNLIVLSLLVFIFAPVLVAAKVSTVPEFLSRYFGEWVRRIFVVATILINVLTFMAAVLYAGGLALQVLTGLDLWVCILAIGLVSGIWAIYGGLSSVAWTDLFTVVVMFVGGGLVTYLGLQSLSADGSALDGFSVMLQKNAALGGVWKEAVQQNLAVFGATENYDRLSVFHGLNHPLTPVSGLVFGVLSIGIWYNVLNQFIVQRILAARDLWHARMGIVFAGFAKILMPLLIVFPGLILFAQHPEWMLGGPAEMQRAADQGYVGLMQELLPQGLRGLVIAALFGTIQSTVNSVLNSTATIATLDVYKPAIHPDASDKELVRFGFWASVTALAVSLVVAFALTLFEGGVFQYIQSLNAFFAPPFAAMFLLALFWRGVTQKGSLFGMLAGFSLAVLLKVFGAFSLLPYFLTSFLNQAAFVWLFTFIAVVVISLATRRSEPQGTLKFADVWKQKELFKGGMGNSLASSVILWWGLFAVLILLAVLYFSGLFNPGGV